jgi:PKD repeat protein
MKKTVYSCILFLALLSFSLEAFAQATGPEKVITPLGFDILRKLSDVRPIQPGYLDRSWKDGVIPNKDGFLTEFDKPAVWTGPDPVLQSKMLKSLFPASIGRNFGGLSNTSGVAPPDTDGDISPGYYMQMVNLSFQIFDRNGNSLYGPALSSTLWDGFTGAWTGTNDGDPVVLYDQFADRWIATQFSLPNYPSGPFYQLVAVSKTNDPTGAWYRYAYQFANMPDYPKFGVWPDGYYFTVNQFKPPSLSFAGAGVCVLDRAAMISGDPNARMLLFNLGTSYGSLLPADADGAGLPPAGSPNYLANLGTNALRIWKASINWSNTTASSVSLVQTLATQPFSYSGISIRQPGTSQTLDALASRLMYRLQYRNFGTYQVMLTNHTVNANGSGQAGVRWYELRNSGSGWSVYQQGTYAPADGNSRWMASVAMNGNGDIGIGYSVSGTALYPSIRVTGQSKANSGTGILDITETSIVEGTASQTGVNRWGDYSMMSVDPADDSTFWYTSEYSNGGWNWRTRVASFGIPSPAVLAPVASFSANPATVMAGQQVSFTDLSANNPSSWSWTFPGGTPSSSVVQNPAVVYSTPGVYSVSLVVYNSAGSDTLVKPGYINVTAFNPSYCSSSGASAGKEWINAVGLGSYTNTSGADNGYGDFTAQPVPVVSGSSYGLSLNPGFSGKPRSEYWRVWIDYNKDGDFLDNGELVYSANAQKGNVSGTIAIPPGLSGETRMRVSMKYNAAPASCEQFSFGEVEDYTLSFSATPPAQPGSGTGDGRVTAENGSTLSSGEKPLILEIYPNPATEVLNVNVTGNSPTINIKIYNSIGQILEDFNTTASLAGIDLGGYRKGIYFIGADDGVHTALKKFIRE